MGEEKMSVLAGLKPERVFYYFEELCRIPHGSGNTKEVSDYLVQFARDHEGCVQQLDHPPPGIEGM